MVISSMSIGMLANDHTIFLQYFIEVHSIEDLYFSAIRDHTKESQSIQSI